MQFTLLLKTKIRNGRIRDLFKLWVDNVVIIWVAKKSGTALMVQLQNYATSKPVSLIVMCAILVVEQAITYDDATKTLKASGESILFNNVGGVMVDHPGHRSPIPPLAVRTFPCQTSIKRLCVRHARSWRFGKSLKADHGVVLFDEPLTSTQTTPLIAAFDDAAHASYSAGAAPSTSRTTASARLSSKQTRSTRVYNMGSRSIN